MTELNEIARRCLTATYAGGDDTQEEQPASPVLQNGLEAMALLTHSCMLAAGFRLVGLSEDDYLVDNSGRLPARWNRLGGGNFAFRYRHEQSAMSFLVKCSTMARNFMVHALPVEDNAYTRDSNRQVPEMRLADWQLFTAPAAQFPFDMTIHSVGEVASQLFPRAQEFQQRFKEEIIGRLVPGLNKPGYEQTGQQQTSSSEPAAQTERHEHPRVLPPRPLRPAQPIVPYPGGIGGDGRHPMQPPWSVGDQDLNPQFGPMGPARPGLITPGGGMLVGPEHPMFQQPPPPPRPGAFGPQQPGVAMPPGAVPPGARFDPVSPFGYLPGASGAGRGGGRGRGGPLSGDPDFDELAPPGGYNPFL